jgi:hypothetical protein
MTRLSLSLLLITAVAGCFAACSSSSSDSGAPNGGSVGQAGANEAGEAGAGGSSDNTGGASDSAGGDTGTAGTEATSGAPGTDESGGAAGEPNGASGSTGNPNGGLNAGGSAGTGNGGSGSGVGGTSGSAGNSAAGGTGTACDQAAHAAFANGLAAYFLAQVAAQDCLAQQTLGSGDSAINACGNNDCAGSVGCATNFVWHDAAYDASTGQFTVQVDISSSVALTQSAASGGATCTLSDQDSSAQIVASISTNDNGTRLSAQLDGLQRSPGTPDTSGCEAITDIATVTLDAAAALLAQAVNDADTALVTYQLACTN